MFLYVCIDHFHVQTQSPIYHQQFSGSGVAPTFVKVKQQMYFHILSNKMIVKLVKVVTVMCSCAPPPLHSCFNPPHLHQCLHDVSALKGQLVVLECRLRGTPPLQVMWYREDEQVLDSDDFRILRKSECVACQRAGVVSLGSDSLDFKVQLQPPEVFTAV